MMAAAVALLLNSLGPLLEIGVTDGAVEIDRGFFDTLILFKVQ
jgi:hypothetical protein